MAPRPPEGVFQPITIQDVRALLVLPRREARMIGTTLAFSERAITATDPRGVTMKSFPYDTVTHAAVSRSRLPRGVGGAEMKIPGGISEVFTRGAVRPWLTIETVDDFLVLRVDPAAIRQVLDLLRQRTKAPLERFEDPRF